MPYLYFPGCQYTTHSAKHSTKAQNYLNKQFGMQNTGCCRINYHALTSKDTAICVCPTCLTNLKACAPSATTCSIWELLESDSQFQWPDYNGMSATIQDCKDTCNNHALKRAVRSILSHMNINIVEAETSSPNSGFCRPHTEE